MFQDILTLKSCTDLFEKTLEDQFLFGTFTKHLTPDTLPSIFDDFLDPQSQNNIKDSSEEVNTQELSPQKCLKEKKKRVRQYKSDNPNNKKGHWTTQQNLLYHYFLELHAAYFIDSERRKVDKIFKSMASFIETREAHQCRSHHQKIQKKWGSFPEILLNLRLENFNKMSSKTVAKELQKLGYEKLQIFSQEDLLHPQQLYLKIQSQRINQNAETEQNKAEQKNQIQQIEGNLLRCHQQNYICLMMSENYEDQLKSDYLL